MINVRELSKNNLFKLRVVPNSSRTELVEDDGKLKLYLQAVPDKNKANRELIKYFKKVYKLNVEIKFGLRSRDKTLIIIDKF